MFVPDLSLPEQGDKPASDAIAPRTDKINAWIEDLPRANPFEALRMATQVVMAWNRTTVPPDKRFHAQQMLLPLVLDLGQILRREYQDAELPLVERKKQRADLMQQLWSELGNGYKISVMEMVLSAKNQNPPELLAPALYQSIVALSNVLLEAYLVFGSERPKTWYELHHLVRCAESVGVADKPISVNIANPRNGVNITQAYAATMIAHLADPYHLLPGEILKFLAEIHRFTPLLQFFDIQSQLPEPGTVAIDMERDLPPRLLSLSGTGEEIKIGKRVNTEKVREALSKAAEERRPPTAHRGPQKSTLGERAHRDMYMRILKSFVPRQERQSKREENAQQICVVAGMESCHFFVNNRRPFTPEADLQQAAAASVLPDMTLIDGEDIPWFEELDDALAPSGRAAVYSTAVGLSDPDDVWTQVYHSDAQQSQLQQTDAANSHLPNTTCEVRDTSKHGLSASIPLVNSNLRIRVGSIVALQTPQEMPLNDTAWSVGAVRWLKMHKMQRIDLGIEILANDALAVATKAVDGVGKGSEYFRAMLIPKADPKATQTTLIAPPAIYDEGTTILLNTGFHIYQARIIRLIEGASSFARYEFRLVE